MKKTNTDRTNFYHNLSTLFWAKYLVLKRIFKNTTHICVFLSNWNKIKFTCLCLQMLEVCINCRKLIQKENYFYHNLTVLFWAKFGILKRIFKDKAHPYLHLSLKLKKTKIVLAFVCKSLECVEKPSIRICRSEVET